MDSPRTCPSAKYAVPSAAAVNMLSVYTQSWMVLGDGRNHNDRLRW
ncbi:MAG: hypothetical protein ACK42H_08505 [Planctomycetota bacterium]